MNACGICGNEMGLHGHRCPPEFRRPKRLKALPSGIDPPNGRCDRFAFVRDKFWAYVYENRPFQPQEFFVLLRDGWHDRTFGGAVPYKTLMKLAEEEPT